MSLAISPIVTAQAGIQSAQTTPEREEKKELVATVETVNAERKTIKVQELTEPIALADSTVFDDEVQLKKLHAGSKVKLVGSISADGKFNVVEVRAAK